jgi:hypothetical protein
MKSSQLLPPAHDGLFRQARTSFLTTTSPDSKRLQTVSLLHVPSIPYHYCAFVFVTYNFLFVAPTIVLIEAANVPDDV